MLEAGDAGVNVRNIPAVRAALDGVELSPTRLLAEATDLFASCTTLLAWLTSLLKYFNKR